MQPCLFKNRVIFFRDGLVPVLVLLCFCLFSKTVAAPINDNFADRLVITSTSTIITGNSFDGSKEPGEPDHAGSPGGSSVWWTWTAPFSGTMVLDALNSFSG